MSSDQTSLNSLPSGWLDAMPWVEATQVPRLAAETGSRMDDESLLVLVVREVMATQRAVALGELFPFIPKRFELGILGLGVRATNCVHRAGWHMTGDLLRVSVDDIYQLRNAGFLTASEIATSCARVNLEWAVGDEGADPVSTENEPLPERAVEGAERDPSLYRLPELDRIAQYWAALGRPQQALLEEVPSAAAPLDVQEAYDRIFRLTSERLAGQLPDAAEVVSEVVAGLSERDVDIVRRRLVASEPLTLDAVGQAHGVTRERIRQIVGQLKSTLAETIFTLQPVQDLRAAVTSDPAPVTPLSQLLELAPVLASPIPTLGEPLWRVLDVLDDGFEIADGWVGRPDVGSAERQTIEAVDAAIAATDDGLTAQLVDVPLPLDSLRSTDEVKAEWLRHCGLTVMAGHVLRTPGSLQAWAAALLTIHGAPLADAEIHSMLPEERSIRSLRNAMSVDHRLHRVDPERWALKTWGMPEYDGIRGAIDAVLEREGGEATIALLTTELPSRFSVSAGSVVAYASMFPFELRNGVVRRAPGELSTTDPFGSARMYRSGKDWLYRVVVNSEHLRGSGSTMPKGIATVLRMRTGESRTLESPLGSQLVSWVSPQVTLGSIRRFLAAMGAEEGDQVLARFGPDGTFDLERPVTSQQTPWHRVAGLAGAGQADDPRVYLVEAMGLTADSSLEEVQAALESRGESDLVSLLSEGWRVPG